MGILLGEVEEGMPVYDLHNEPVGTVSRVVRIRQMRGAS
jgi:hypothetical protein